ncbi:MAG: glycosyltransferase family 9 protein [Nitrospinae bacterium]|nr:glycosyltransferase family 9 protein [Nitrospinota bacterium]
MKNILILNLTRMGDLLQTTPLIAGLKKKYPDSKITLLANKTFAGICSDIPFIDEVYTFDIKQFTPESGGEEPSLLKIYRYLDGLVDRVKSKNFDTVINLSHSKLTGIFSSLLNAPDIRGITSTDYGHRVIRHPWLNYFCNIIFNRHYNRFNLADIYQKSGDVEPFSKKLFLNISEGGMIFADEFLKRNGFKEGDMLVGFQPASSRPDRRWSSDSFARLGLELMKRYGAKIIIFGVPSEKGLGDEIQAKMNNHLNPPFLKGEVKGVINAVGKTSVGELASLLKRCHLLITNDTGTMHIAAALGTRIVALFFAHALVHETGPYGEGHIILQAEIPCSPCSHHTNCKNPLCKDYITVEDVITAVEILKSQESVGIGEISRAIRNRGLEKIYHGQFQKVKPFYSSFDSDNMIEFLPLIKRPVDLSDIVGYAYRAMWKKVLVSNGILGRFQPSPLIESGVSLHCKEIAEKIKNHFEIRTDTTANQLDDVLTSFGKLIELGKEGISVTHDIIKKVSKAKFDVEDIKELGNKINCIDENINLISLTEPSTGPIVSMFKFSKENLQGNNILPLAEDTLQLYNNLTTEAKLMKQLLEGIQYIFQVS